MKAAHQQRGELEFTEINRLHLPVAWGSMLLIVGVLALAARWREFAGIGELAATVSLAILANAAVCGALSNPNDRYGARMVWLATLVVLMVPWMRGRKPNNARSGYTSTRGCSRDDTSTNHSLSRLPVRNRSNFRRPRPLIPPFVPDFRELWQDAWLSGHTHQPIAFAPPICSDQKLTWAATCIGLAATEDSSGGWNGKPRVTGPGAFFLQGALRTPYQASQRRRHTVRAEAFASRCGRPIFIRATSSPANISRVSCSSICAICTWRTPAPHHRAVRGLADRRNSAPAWSGGVAAHRVAGSVRSSGIPDRTRPAPPKALVDAPH
jgi:hypothetical protein